ncbi:hypothetical protein [Streptomyces pseudogriseolus]|uniref:hypothetical protein n=1 Tax=Streptomyces pseudogriseolus TaxID=36817 RepID=UPI003FA31EA3
MGKRTIRSGQLPVIVETGLGPTTKPLANVQPGTHVEAFDVTIRHLRYINRGAMMTLAAGDNVGLARADAAVLVRYTRYIEQGAGVTVRGTISTASDTPLIEVTAMIPVVESASTT